ncbi:hypothetical protein V2J94_41080 [Streptomyces sp. DSM 41524]|uniref:Uncharacterized protein n=1 Tax=Streptomyces asiaticus subsp. ignotus TaxID=3098222 RepID=A0ABU7Q9V1_9ACTN|nr:hypothetical protein [Streptomyces sp. DSM 41524]
MTITATLLLPRPGPPPLMSATVYGETNLNVRLPHLGRSPR